MSTIHLWNKETILDLSDIEKDQWFDVYNHGLLEDRGFVLTKKTSKEAALKTIKQDYLSYLNHLPEDANFLCYIILYDMDKIVSLCRLVKRNNNIFIAGLETHRDFQRRGFAKSVLKRAVEEGFRLGFEAIHSSIRQWNQASVQAHLAVGFVIHEKKTIIFY